MRRWKITLVADDGCLMREYVNCMTFAEAASKAYIMCAGKYKSSRISSVEEE